MTTPPPILPAPSPLTPVHLAGLHAANRRAKTLRRTQRVAAIDAWLAAIFAGVALLSGLFSYSALPIGAALALVAWNSFRGLELLRRFDPRAAKLLALNQLFLASSLSAYFLYALYVSCHTDYFADVAAGPEIQRMLEPYRHLVRTFTTIVYMTLIAATLIFQSLTALYYFTRQKHLLAYRQSTPQWIRDLQSAAR